MPDSFATTYAPLVEQIRAARAQGDERAAGLALEVLLKAYVRLGNREVGTAKEQTDYIVARHLGFLPNVLQELGVRLNDLPEPPGRRRPVPTPAHGVDVTRIAAHFARLGGPGEPKDRFAVEYRPQDGMLYRGRPAPWAVIDSADGQPVAWYLDQDWAEYTAATASRLRRPA